MDDPEDNARRERESRIGRTLRGRHTLEAVIGFGGMATVYRGKHRNGHKVAVKVLNRELSASADIRARFLREGQLANQVDHPGAVNVIDEDVDEDGSVFLVMELLEGETLAARIARKTLAPAEIVPLMVQLLDVLEAAHAKGIVHRDIKPENLFLQRRDGRLRVLDFGVARLVQGDGRKTETGRVMGTPAYMAPEQARGEGERVDGRTDLWAVGAVLYRGLSGRFVHEADTSQMTMVLAATQAATPLREVAPAAPAELCEVVDRALRSKMTERWQTAAEMRHALDPAGERDRVGISGFVGATPADPEARTEAPRRPPHSTQPDLTPAPHQFAARPRVRASRPALLGLSALAALAATALAWQKSRPLPPSPEPKPEAQARQESAPSVASSAPSAGPSAQSGALAAPSLAAPVVAPARQVPVRAAVLARAMASSAGTTETLAAGPPATKASGATPSASANPGCDPPFYFDADGNKRRKLECYK